MPRQIVARISVRESHPDGTGRVFEVTRIIDENMTVRELFEWRRKKIHAPLDGEFASTEIVLSPDATEEGD